MKEYHHNLRAGIGRKFQTPSIYEDLTVFENLEISFPRGRTVFGALGFRRDAEVRNRIDEVARTIFLASGSAVPAELLSHGQKRWSNRHAADAGLATPHARPTGSPA